MINVVVLQLDLLWPLKKLESTMYKKRKLGYPIFPYRLKSLLSSWLIIPRDALIVSWKDANKFRNYTCRTNNVMCPGTRYSQKSRAPNCNGMSSLLKVFRHSRKLPRYGSGLRCCISALVNDTTWSDWIHMYEQCTPHPNNL